MNENNLEIEVKFLVEHVESIRRHLIEIGAESLGRHFETNRRYDDAQSSLLKKHSLLRLRKSDKIRLTFKSEPSSHDGEFKIYKELEVGVDDFDTMGEILIALGYKPVQIYEKWRETYNKEGCLICIDEMPYGKFIEIEGSKEQIRAISDELGLEWENRILDNYLNMFHKLKEHYQLTFTDLTFENFKNLALSFSDCRHLLER